MMDLFTSKRIPPPTYRPPLEASQIIEVFAQLTLHQQAALMRLMSRNLIIRTGSEDIMGYELDFNVEGALVAAEPASDED